MEKTFFDKKDYTGEPVLPEKMENSILKIVPFNQYLIVVRLTDDGRFIGIEEIRINKDFRSFNQKISQRIIHFIDEYKPEE